VPPSGATRLAGVIGWPVEHSRSPQMHDAAYAALGLDWAYVPLPVAPGRLEPALAGLAALGFAGANVTVPHKVAAAACCATLSDAARRAGSVNTLLPAAGGLHGETTDGPGLLDAVAARGGAVPREGTLLLLGAGGAARAAAAALLDAGVSRLAVSARRGEAAEALVRRLRPLAPAARVEAAPWPFAGPAPVAVVNATPLGGSDRRLPLPERMLAGAQLVCDLAYRADGEPTALVGAGRRAGAVVVDGIDVLVHQGARSFALWCGVEPPLDVMERAARRLPGAAA
jgi:shikimate dehydrogenase